MTRLNMNRIVATLASVLGGGLLGSLTAALSVTWFPPTTAQFHASARAAAEPPAEPVVSAPSATSEPARNDPPVASATPSAGAPPSAASLGLEGPLPEWMDDPLPDDQKQVEAAAISCARRNAVDCMRAGDAYDEGRGVDRNERNARLNRSAGVRLFSEKCKQRQPDACYALSVIYSLGQGVEPSPQVADGMFTRARQLCRGSEADICQHLPPLNEE